METKMIKNGVKSVSTAIDIIDLISTSPDGATLSEISFKLRLSKPSILRHLNTLIERNYIIRDDVNFRYMLGMRLYVLGDLAENNLDLLSLSDSIMRQLRDHTGLTVNLAAFQSNCVIILKSVLGTDATEVRVRIGTELPYHATSQGRIAMAFSRRNLFDTVRNVGLSRFTEFTITKMDALEADVRKVRARGWCMASQETRMGINAMSAPVMDSTGNCVAAITLVALMHNLAREPALEQVSALLSAASQLTKQLGGKPFRPNDEAFT